jgi:hypothetical protein
MFACEGKDFGQDIRLARRVYTRLKASFAAVASVWFTFSLFTKNINLNQEFINLKITVWMSYFFFLVKRKHIP